MLELQQYSHKPTNGETAMNLTDIAAKLFMQQLGSQGAGIDANSLQGALAKLLPMAGGDLDVTRLLSMFTQGGGLASMAQSWLGDGSNDALSTDNLMSILGQSKVNDFASELGLDTDAATTGLTGMIPELIDKASSGGSLQQDLAGSLMKGLAGKFF